jgi:hypothetical protein
MEKDNLLYLIELNNNIIGTYDNLYDAETYILGCFQNNFFKSAKIKVFKKNSCYLIDTKIYSSNNSITLVNKPTTNDKILIKENSLFHDNNEAFLLMAKQKMEIQHKINLLKVQKEKMEESKRVFDNDLKLFNLFHDSKKKDINFVIPELFKKKYDIMIKLDSDNKLTWNDFIKEYNTGENNYDDYFVLNNYESEFLESENKNNNFSEEINIESDSSTESSDN